MYLRLCLRACACTCACARAHLIVPLKAPRRAARLRIPGLSTSLPSATCVRRPQALSSDTALIRLLEERKEVEGALRKAKGRAEKLEGLCRTLQDER